MACTAKRESRRAVGLDEDSYCALNIPPRMHMLHPNQCPHLVECSRLEKDR